MLTNACNAASIVSTFVASCSAITLICRSTLARRSVSRACRFWDLRLSGWHLQPRCYIAAGRPIDVMRSG
jgi:hypothetical protein